MRWKLHFPRTLIATAFCLAAACKPPGSSEQPTSSSSPVIVAPSPAPTTPLPVEPLTRMQVRKGGTTAFIPNATEPYTGWFVRPYDGSEQIQLRLRLAEGKVAEMIRFFPNGETNWAVGLIPAATETILPDALAKYPDYSGEHGDSYCYQAEFIHGRHANWYTNGQQRFEISYDQGKWHGPGRFWHENGERSVENQYDHGRLVADERWLRNGTKDFESRVQDGSGKVVFRSEEGKKTALAYYHEGVISFRDLFDDSGTYVTRKQIFEADELARWINYDADGKITEEWTTEQMKCINNLKQVVLGFRIYASDNDDRFPFELPRAKGGSRELCDRDRYGNEKDPSAHFNLLTNEFGSPKILLCPGDTNKTAAVEWTNPPTWEKNISYHLQTGDHVREGSTNSILIWCPIHQHLGYCNGEVKRGSKADLLRSLLPHRQAVLNIARQRAEQAGKQHRDVSDRKKLVEVEHRELSKQVATASRNFETAARRLATATKEKEAAEAQAKQAELNREQRHEAYLAAVRQAIRTHGGNLRFIPNSEMSRFVYPPDPVGRVKSLCVSPQLMHGLILLENGSIKGWRNKVIFNNDRIIDPPPNLPLHPPNQQTIAVAAGKRFSVAVTRDGRVHCWSADPPPLKTDHLIDVASVTCGLSGLLALKKDGTVETVFDAEYGRAALQPGMDAIYDLPSDLTNVTALRIVTQSRYNRALALKQDGGLVAWGNPDAKERFHRLPPGTDFVAIAAGAGFNLALRRNGTIAAWGIRGNDKIWDQAADLANIVAIDADNLNAAAIEADGTLHVWGYDSEFANRINGLKNVVGINLLARAILTKSDSGLGTVVADAMKNWEAVTFPDLPAKQKAHTQAEKEHELAAARLAFLKPDLKAKTDALKKITAEEQQALANHNATKADLAKAVAEEQFIMQALETEK